MRKIGKYLVHIGCVLVGFYAMGVVLAFVESSNGDFLSTLNQLGVFLSSVGVVAAILTVIQQQYLKDAAKEQQEIKEATILQFKLRHVIAMCEVIRLEAKVAVESDNSFHKLLDGDVSDYIFDLKMEEFTFVSNMNHTVYSELYYATLNYNRLVVGIFSWQKRQEAYSYQVNAVNYNDRIDLLETYSQSIIRNHHHLALLLNKEYQGVDFYHAEVHPEEFANLPRFDKI